MTIDEFKEEIKYNDFVVSNLIYSKPCPNCNDNMYITCFTADSNLRILEVTFECRRCKYTFTEVV